MTSRLFLE